jgi:hypothetical protein
MRARPPRTHLIEAAGECTGNRPVLQGADLDAEADVPDRVERVPGEYVLHLQWRACLAARLHDRKECRRALAEDFRHEDAQRPHRELVGSELALLPPRRTICIEDPVAEEVLEGVSPLRALVVVRKLCDEHVLDDLGVDRAEDTRVVWQLDRPCAPARADRRGVVPVVSLAGLCDRGKALLFAGYSLKVLATSRVWRPTHLVMAQHFKHADRPTVQAVREEQRGDVDHQEHD